MQLADNLAKAGERPYGHVNCADDHVQFACVEMPKVGARYIHPRRRRMRAFSVPGRVLH
jgi:hypothetical protein